MIRLSERPGGTGSASASVRQHLAVGSLSQSSTSKASSRVKHWLSQCHPGIPLLLASALLMGCDQSSGETGDVYVDHDHEIRPAHHPESFPAAVESLKTRLPTLAAADDAGRTEAAEIVGWMPELAADSDLTGAEWEPLAAGARALESLLPRVAAGDAAALTEANAALDRLAGRVREYGRDEFDVVPHENHHHDDHAPGHDDDR